MVVSILCNAIFCSINIYESVYFSLTFFFYFHQSRNLLTTKETALFLSPYYFVGYDGNGWTSHRESAECCNVYTSLLQYTHFIHVWMCLFELKVYFFFTFIEVAIYLRLWRQCFFKTLTPRAIWECYNAHTFLLQVRSLLYILGQDVQRDKTESFILSWVSFSRRYHSLFIPLNSFCIR